MLSAVSRTRSSGQARRAANRGPDHTSPFANDPVRIAPLPFSERQAAKLAHPVHLETSLIDFLLQHAFMFPADERFPGMPKDLLIASSNSYEFLKIMTDVKKYPPTSKTALDPVRRGYRSYGSGQYRLLVVNCMGDFAHYHAVDVSFDIDSDEIFQHVRVYDSIAGGSRKTKEIDKFSAEGQYLCRLQTFLVRFCFFTKREQSK